MAPTSQQHRSVDSDALVDGSGRTADVAERPNRLSFPASPAFLRRFSALLLSSTLVLLLAGSALATIDSPRPMVAQQLSAAEWSPDELPDVAVLLTGIDDADPVVEETLVPRLAEIPGVSQVSSESAPSGRTAVFISLATEGAGPTGDRTLEAIDSTLGVVVPDAGVALGGRAIADRDLLDRLNRGTIVAVLPVLVLLTVLVAATFGLRFGLAAGGTVGAATLLSGLLGSRMAGDFDGSLATTALPAVLVALLVSTVLTFRLLDWFKHPQGHDQTETIQRSVRHLLPESALLFGGLLVTSIILAAAGPGRTPTVMVTLGLFLAGLVTLAVLPAMLVSMPAVPDDEDYRLFKVNLPDGRDFPTAVLAGFALFLLALGLFAVRVPTSELLDESALPDGVASRRVSEQLVDLGGDPTSALVVQVSSSASSADLATWARGVSSLPAVGWTETQVGRYVDGQLSAESANPARFTGADGSSKVIVTPQVTARSRAAQMLVEDIRAFTALEASGLAPAEVELSGAVVDAANTAEDAAANLWLLVLTLAVAGGVSVLVLVGDVRVALVAGLLRLVGTGALLGVYGLVSGAGSAVELHVAALVLSVGVGLFEIGFIRRLVASTSEPTDVISVLLEPDESEPVTETLRREGKAAMLGLGVTALTGLGFLTSDLEMARRLGIALAVGLVIELLIATWLLRPVVLGRISGASAAPRRSARFSLESLTEGRLGLRSAVERLNLGHDQPEEVVAVEPEEVLDPAWRRVVSGLLRAEFAFQTDPENAELATVFVEGTPVFGELEIHNRRLREAGFRVLGKGPRLLKVSAINESSPVTLAISVDHPERRLVDRDGRVLGVRKSEQRDGMLWLAQDPSGRYRIAEAVDLGTAELAALPASSEESVPQPV